MLELYSYFRSSAAFRVRIALNIKQLDYQLKTVDIFSGVHQEKNYQNINSQGLIPSLKLSDGSLITQSMSILEYLEETYPSPALLPNTPAERAKLRSWYQVITCDIHPLDNLRVLKYLTGNLSVSEENKLDWYHHWIRLGFDHLEQELIGTPFSNGAELSMVDCCLIPQVYNAHRFKLDMSDFKKIQSIYDTCMQLPAFDKAKPENQPDSK